MEDLELMKEFGKIYDKISNLEKENDLLKERIENLEQENNNIHIYGLPTKRCC